MFSTYDTTERPVTHEHDNLDVSIGLSIQQIVDIDEKKQTIIFSGWLDMVISYIYIFIYIIYKILKPLGKS